MDQHSRIFPKRCKVRPVFKTREEYEAWKDSWYKDILPELKELELKRARSYAQAMGLNPDAVKL